MYYIQEPLGRSLAPLFGSGARGQGIFSFSDSVDRNTMVLKIDLRASVLKGRWFLYVVRNCRPSAPFLKLDLRACVLKGDWLLFDTPPPPSPWIGKNPVFVACLSYCCLWLQKHRHVCHQLVGGFFTQTTALNRSYIFYFVELQSFFNQFYFFLRFLCLTVCKLVLVCPQNPY